MFLVRRLVSVYVLMWLPIGDVAWSPGWGGVCRLPPPGSSPTLSSAITVCSPHWRRGRSLSSFWGWCTYRNYLEIWMGDLPFIPLLSIQWFIYIWMGTWMYRVHTYGYNPILFYFVAHIVPALVKGGPASLWHVPDFVVVVVVVLLYCLALLALYFLCIHSKISHFFKKLRFLLLRRMMVDTKGTRCTHCCWGALAFRVSQLTEQGNVWILAWVYMYATLYK